MCPKVIATFFYAILAYILVLIGTGLLSDGWVGPYYGMFSSFNFVIVLVQYCFAGRTFFPTPQENPFHPK